MSNSDASDAIKIKEESQKQETDSEIKEMVRNAVHFGHKKTRQHPKMSAYIFGVRNTVNIIHF